MGISMLPDGAYLALALCSLLVLRLAGRSLPPGLGPWLTERFDEMEAHLEDLRQHECSFLLLSS